MGGVGFEGLVWHVPRDTTACWNRGEETGARPALMWCGTSCSSCIFLRFTWGRVVGHAWWEMWRHVKMLVVYCSVCRRFFYFVCVHVLWRDFIVILVSRVVSLVVLHGMLWHGTVSFCLRIR